LLREEHAHHEDVRGAHGCLPGELGRHVPHQVDLAARVEHHVARHVGPRGAELAHGDERSVHVELGQEGVRAAGGRLVGERALPCTPTANTRPSGAALMDMLSSMPLVPNCVV
jgi:hypothetical protein